MPIMLPPIASLLRSGPRPSRRAFLGGLAAAGAAALAPRWLLAEAEKAAARPVDPNRIALFSDTHIDANREYKHKTGCVPWETFGQAAGQVLGLDTRPAAAIVNGDCAAMKGLPDDYATVLAAVNPIRQGGLPLHMVLGNHDDRANFRTALKHQDKRGDESDDHVVSLIETPRANLFLLDSLETTNKTPGKLGEKQIAWLTRALDARADKPALLFIHHDPVVPAADAARKKPPTGLLDTEDLYKAILPRKQVKAWVFGHTHVWAHAEKEGVHLVNLPPTAWLFNQTLPRGWVDLTLTETGATFELRSLDPAHKAHGQKLDLKWRA